VKGKTIFSAKHKRLIAEIKRHRKLYGLRQVELARRLGVTHVWISRLESGERRIDVVEFMQLAKAIGFDPLEVLRNVWKL
jgi:transcriptional regulator with XRE-family HTH domain